MKKIMLAAALAAASTTASAQISNFGGFSSAINLNGSTVTTNIGLNGTAFDVVGERSWNGSLQAAYGFVASQSTIFTVGATYGIGKINSGDFNSGNKNGIVKITTEDQLSLYVEPGFLINEKTLVYGKFSYEGANVVLTDNDSESDSIKGTGLAFGLRRMIDKSSFIQVEFKTIKYRLQNFQDSESIFETKATVATIGFGINF